MAKVSPVYRGTPEDDPKGFQPEAIGNYKAKSDVADLDNIYLSDQGWVYRHFKPRADDSEAYWDEIIWAGDVSGPGPANTATPSLVPATPEANDPVGIFGAESQTFQSPPLDPLGDGIQFVTGDYPASSSIIKTIEISGPDSVDSTQAIPYTVVLSGGGALANTDTYAWEVTGPGVATFSAGTRTGTFTGNTPAQANVSITFPVKGSYQVKCTLTSVSGDGLTSEGVKTVGAQEHIAAPTIGTVNVTGSVSPQAGVGVVYHAEPSGTVTDSDIDSYTWSCVFVSDNSNNAGATITQPGDDRDECKVVFSTRASCAPSKMICNVKAATASDNNSGAGVNGDLAVTAHTVMGDATATIGGSSNVSMVKATTTAAAVLAYAGTSNPAPNDLTYAWSVNPSNAGTFNDAAIAGPTFTAANSAGAGQIKCVVSSALSEPDTEDSTVIFVTITDS